MAINDFLLIAPKNELETIAIKNEVLFEEGLPRLEPGAKRPRSFDDYLNSVLSTTSQIDLKLRYSRHRVARDRLVVAVGLTSFQEYREAFSPEGLPDSELVKKLQEEGETAMHNKWARFARPIGLTAVVMDGTGALVLGKRQELTAVAAGGVTEYIDFYHSPAGYFAFTTKPNEVSIMDTALYFLSTNYNIQRSSVLQIRTMFIAAHPETGETDIVCLVKTDASSGHFADNGPWREAERSGKYMSLVRVGLNNTLSFLASNDVVYGTAALLNRLGRVGRV